jgi:hypothetical protein
MEVKGLMFKQKKLISILKPKMYVYWFNVFFTSKIIFRASNFTSIDF